MRRGYGSQHYFENLIKESRRPVLPRVLDLKPIPVDSYQQEIAERAQRELYGFKYRDLNKLMSRLPSDESALNLRLWIRLTFIKLKIVVDSYHELTDYCRFMWKRCLCLEGQETYQDAMDDALTSIKKPLFKKMTEDEVEVDFTTDYNVMKRHLKDIEPRLWLPLTSFPLWDIQKEPKLPLAFEPEPVGHEDDVRSCIRLFLRKYGPRETFVPSDLACKKVGSQKYNDGGLVKRDSERPERSYKSGFLYQKFVTKPLQSRECWLPGKAIKDNNGWWFIVVDSILRNVPYSALLKEPEEIWASIRSKITSAHVMFDISGYGIQFPRNYLRIAIQEIVKAYPGIQISEHVDIAEKILGDVELQMPDGKFLHPPRGIGLGYYENLKTLIVMAIIDFADPISVYGDQAILSYGGTAKRGPDSLALKAVARLKEVGFLFTKEEKTYYTLSRLKWSGQIMSKRNFFEPRTTWSGIFGALGKEFHWERKNALHGVILPEDSKHIWKRVAYQYERAFGHEFALAESLQHPDNGGLDPNVTRYDGWTRFWKVAKLREPSIKYEQGIFVCIPFSGPPKRGEARRFSKLRQRVYKSTRPFDMAYINYVEPVIEFNKKRKPDLSPFARSMPLWAEIRNLVFENITTGKLASGLKGDELAVAPLHQKYAPDPFMARATGGYEILTSWRGTRGANADFEIIADALAMAENEGFQMVWREDVDPAFWSARPFTRNPYHLAPVESREEAMELEDRPIHHVTNSILERIKQSYLEETPDVDLSQFVDEEIFNEVLGQQEATEVQAVTTRLRDMIGDYMPNHGDVLKHNQLASIEESLNEEDHDLYDFDPREVGLEDPTIYGWKY